MNSVSKALRMGCVLSNAATQGSGKPSSTSSFTSVGMPRIVLVTGATKIHVRTGTASDLVTTSTGRRLSSDSAHQISPCAGATTAPR